MEIEPAQKNDADDLAYLIDIAGEGIPQYLWSQMAENGQSALAVGAQRAAREEGGFSYRNAYVCRDAGSVLGMIIAYRLPAPYLIGELDEYPALVRPLIQLEAKVPGSWYINALATYEAVRGLGVARMLMVDAQERGRLSGCESVSLIVASENLGARRLYQRLGYQEMGALPIVEYPGCHHQGSWLLMSKALES